MARLKKDLHKYVEIREEDYLQLVENTMIVEAMKLAGVEKLPLWKAVRRILDDRRIEIHVKPDTPIDPKNWFPSKKNQSIKHQKPSKTTFFRGLLSSMYLVMSSILLSLLSESETRYKNLTINVLY